MEEKKKESSLPTLRAVWPPMDTKMESGLSFSMTLRTISGVMGRKYTFEKETRYQLEKKKEKYREKVRE